MKRLRDVRRKRNFSVNKKRSAKPLRPWQPSRLRPQPEAKVPNKPLQQNQHQVLQVSLSWLENLKLAPQKISRRRTPRSVLIVRTRKRRNGTSSILIMC